jgi:glycosyltransferase involved in cell wall biosynthesis
VSAAKTWIAWETQRRSLNLSGRLGADLKLFLHKGRMRYPRCLADTAALLAKHRGQVVCVQNPSMILAAWAGVLKGILGYTLVVDRHSNFSHLAGTHVGLKRRLSDLLSGFTLRRADLTIVTNRELAELVERSGGHAFVLPDPFPDLSAWRPRAEAAEARPRQVREVLFVSSWAFDEPIEAAIEACRRLQGEIVMRITGRVPARFRRMLRAAPENFIPTGFLSEDGFFSAMAASDAVMAVTQREATLVCGGYEGAALGKPLILGNSRALREYFDAGCVYTDGSAEDLAERIRGLMADLPAHRAAIRAWHERRASEWETRLAALQGKLASLAVPVTESVAAQVAAARGA